MKLKVGNVVKVIENNNGHDFDVGDILEIIKTDESSISYKCRRIKDGFEQWLAIEDIEPIEYTWEDFLKAPIGTKVTFEQGTLVKTDKLMDPFIGGCFRRDYADLYNFRDNIGEKLLGKIIKIEEPSYITLYNKDEINEMTIEEIENILGYKIRIKS